jgi:hypothetical protein
MKRYLIYIFAMLIAATSAIAQTTKVKGTVKDAYNGEPLPFVNIWFPGTTIGVTTDFDGNYYLETRQSVPDILRAEILGYEPQEQKIVPGGFTSADFSLKPQSISLEGITVKADNSKIRAFMKSVYERKKYNDPDNQETSQGKIYSKMELDIANVDPFLILELRWWYVV